MYVFTDKKHSTGNLASVLTNIHNQVNERQGVEVQQNDPESDLSRTRRSKRVLADLLGVKPTLAQSNNNERELPGQSSKPNLPRV